MLHSIREKAKGWFAWVIVILISVPFALWGIGSYITPDANPAVAMVDESKISIYEFQNALQREQQQLESKSQNIDEKFLKQTVLDRLINSRALLNHLGSEGYMTSRARLNEQILSDPNFKDPKSGNFSETIFKQILQRMGLAYESYERQLADDMLIRQYTNGITNAAWVSPVEIDSVVALLKQKRDISYVLIDSKVFAESIQPSDEEINTYYQSNKESYEVPEKVKVAYIEISRAQIAKTIDISDDEAKTLYDDNGIKYTKPEERQASHILIPFKKDASAEEKNKSKEKVDDLYKQLQNGGDFADLAKQFSKDPGSAKKGGDLGFFGKGVMVPEFEKMAYSLKVNEIGEPIESPFGFHIIKLTAIKEAQVKPFAEVKEEIVSALQYDKAEQIYYEKSESLQTIAYEQPDSLEPAANEINMNISESPLISKTDGEGIFANKKLLAAIFDEQVLEAGNNSDLVSVGNDHVVAVRIVEKVPSSIKPLQEVKASIVKTLISKTANDKALELANSLSKAISEQKDIKEQLSANKLEMVEQGLVDRNDFVTPREIIQKAFTLPRVKDIPESSAFMMQDKQAAVVVVKKVENGNSDDKEFVKMVEGGLKQARGSMFANLAIMQARKNSTIEINQERLSSEDN